MGNEKKSILIVDDDEAVLSALCKVVKTIDMDYLTASSGAEALEMADKNKFDIILMDINMSGMDGFEAIQQMRKNGIKTPIIIISGRKEDFDTIYGLDIGADDYITKPFNPVTLGAKIKALIRRSSNGSDATDKVITAGPFAYNTSTLRFYKNGEEVLLTAKENSMMKLFVDNVNRIFTRDMLYDLVWGNAIIDDNAIMVYINRLRSKIEDDPSRPQYIQTIKGLGYRFVIGEGGRYEKAAQ